MSKPICFKLKWNINQKLDQQIKTKIKKIINRTKAACNFDAIVTESEMHLITSKLDQNINQKPDQKVKI